MPCCFVMIQLSLGNVGAQILVDFSLPLPWYQAYNLVQVRHSIKKKKEWNCEWWRELWNEMEYFITSRQLWSNRNQSRPKQRFRMVGVGERSKQKLERTQVLTFSWVVEHKGSWYTKEKDPWGGAGRWTLSFFCLSVWSWVLYIWPLARSN